MFCDIQALTLMIFIIYSTSTQPLPPESNSGEASDKGSDKSHLKSSVLCSEAGNCSCFFEKFRVTVKCTSVGDNLDQIGSILPQTTTHL